MSRGKLSTPIYMQFPLFTKNCGSFFFTAIIQTPHRTAEMMDSERAGVLLASVLIYVECKTLLYGCT